MQPGGEPAKPAGKYREKIAGKDRGAVHLKIGKACREVLAIQSQNEFPIARFGIETNGRKQCEIVAGAMLHQKTVLVEGMVLAEGLDLRADRSLHRYALALVCHPGLAALEPYGQFPEFLTGSAFEQSLRGDLLLHL